MDIAPETLERINDLTRVDQALYACERFEQRYQQMVTELLEKDHRDLTPTGLPFKLSPKEIFFLRLGRTRLGDRLFQLGKVRRKLLRLE